MPTNNYLQTINDFLSNANFEYTYKLIICPSLIYGRKSEENRKKIIYYCQIIIWQYGGKNNLFILLNFLNKFNF